MIHLTVGKCAKCGEAFRLDFKTIEEKMYLSCNCGEHNEIHPSEELLQKSILMYGNESFFEKYDVDSLTFLELEQLKNRCEDRKKETETIFYFKPVIVAPWKCILLFWIFLTALKFSVPLCGSLFCFHPTEYTKIKETGSARTSMGRIVKSYSGGRELYCELHREKRKEGGWLWLIVYFPGYILSFPCDWPAAMGANVPNFDYYFRWFWTFFLMVAYLKFTFFPNIFKVFFKSFPKK